MPKRPISEKQRLANKANARKSTGPITIRGKSISRRNALKTGLSGAGTCLPENLRAELDREIALFNDKLKPADSFEQRLVERAALASVRLNRINAQRELELDQRRRHAIPLWDQQRADEVERLLGLLETDPDAAVRHLSRLAEGCDALADQWDDLKSILVARSQWLDSDLDRALRLLGEPRRPGPNGPESAVNLVRLALVLNPEPDYSGLLSLIDSSEPEQIVIPEFEELLSLAKAALIELIDLEIQRLQALGDHLWTTIDQPDRQGAPDRCLVDVGEQGARLNRLEADADRQLQRSLNQLEATRREAREAVRAQNEAILTARKLERMTPRRVMSPPRSMQPDPAITQGPPPAIQAPAQSPLPSRYPPNGGP